VVIAFSNTFGGRYEGGANWQESTLLSLGTLPDPPRCLIVGAVTDGALPETLRSASHVRAVPVEDDPEWRAALAGPNPTAAHHRGYEGVAREHGVDLWVGWHDFRGVAPQHMLVVVWPDFHPRRLLDRFEGELRIVIKMEQNWESVLERAQAIFTISESTAAEALEGNADLADRLHVVGFPPVVTPERLALDPRSVRLEYGLPDRYLIVANQFWKHKNHAVVVEALGVLARRGADVPTVAFTGRLDAGGSADYAEEVMRAAARAGVHQQCRFLGHVTRPEQFALLRGASAAVQPSFAEGRGAMLEESLIVGTPVVCSDIPPNREQAPPGTRFFDPEDPDALAEAMMIDLPRRDLTNEEILGDARARQEACGNKFLAACRSALSAAMRA
jgi:glycosyltransferase involved in cell wall biosynthesis